MKLYNNLIQSQSVCVPSDIQHTVSGCVIKTLNHSELTQNQRKERQTHEVQHKLKHICKTPTQHEAVTDSQHHSGGAAAHIDPVTSLSSS